MKAISSPDKAETFSHFLNDLAEVFDIPLRERRKLKKLIFQHDIPLIQSEKPSPTTENSRDPSADVVK
jgi:hypothetical protein